MDRRDKRHQGPREAGMRCIGVLCSKDKGYWRSQIKDYVSFPNPINTCVPHIGTVYRLHMLMHAK